MAKFIELKASSNEPPVLVNVDHIRRIGIDVDTKDMYVHVGNHIFMIADTYEEVKKLLGVE